MNFSQECLYCNRALYQLGDSMVKCSTCKKKYSPKKIEKIYKLIELFCLNTSALQASKSMGITYVSASKYYGYFRHACMLICEEEFEQLKEKDCEYEEYFYLSQSKRSNPSTLFDTYNFITFDYEQHIYNALLPSLKKYMWQVMDENHKMAFSTEFSSFKRKSKIIKLSKNLNKIMEFWLYFEKLISIYKGVSSDAFAYYLKEIEFKFNHDESMQKKLLFQKYIDVYYKN